MAWIESVLEDMIEVEPLDKDGFLKVRETLTRVGTVTRQTDSEVPRLTQMCHVLHSSGRYFICHYKQLFLLDGKSEKTNYTEKDEDTLFKVVNLLEGWNLIAPKDEIEKVDCHVQAIAFKEKANYELKSNYRLGKKHAKKEIN